MTTEEFIQQHANGNVRQLAFLTGKYPDVDMPYALNQIRGRQTARHKLPTWASTDGIVYPPHLSMEQCSSEVTAEYKAGVVASKEKRGDFLDLTGGFGVDFSYMARRIGGHAIYVERQEQLCEVARHNFSLLGLEQAEVICGDGIKVLHQIHHAGVVYLDPARRDGAGNKVVSLSDCTPDVTEIADELLEKADIVMIKLSPMLDWHKAVADLHCVREVHIVSVGNECKELLLVLSAAGEATSPRLFCFNDGQVVEVTEDAEVKGNIPSTIPVTAFDNNKEDTGVKDNTPSTIPVTAFDNNTEDTGGKGNTKPLTTARSISLSSLLSPLFSYLYVPNASLMKAGCFSWICRHYGLGQLAPNSHLFVGEHTVADFPGRTFTIHAVSSFNKKELKRHLQGITHANIAARNFPLSVAELRKRLKLKDGGDTYLFATTLQDGSHALIIAAAMVSNK